MPKVKRFLPSSSLGIYVKHSENATSRCGGGLTLSITYLPFGSPPPSNAPLLLTNPLSPTHPLFFITRMYWLQSHSQRIAYSWQSEQCTEFSEYEISILIIV